MADFRTALDEVIERGGTLEEFRHTFDKIVEKHSWQYNGGRNWRSRIIYDTNLYGAYNHGRYQQQKELADVLPYWEYEHNDSAHPRPHHRAWDGLVLRADDPWWDTHYPTRAYGCHCTVKALDDVDLELQGKQVQQAPEVIWEEKLIGQRSGQPRLVRVPQGVDPSFEHPKRLVPVHQVDQILMHKLASNRTLSQAFVANSTRQLLSNPPIMKLMNRSMQEWVTAVDSYVETGNKQFLIPLQNFKYLGALPAEVLEKLPHKPISPMLAIDKGQMVHAIRELKEQKGIILPVEFWQKLPEKLQNPDAILLEKGQETTSLLFILKLDEGKVSVKVDYDANATDGIVKKWKTQMNMVITGSKINSELSWINFSRSKNFELIYGKLD